MSSDGKLKEADIVSFLKNSPKGQLKYENGWDQKSQAIWQLVSNAQAEAEQPKIAVIERAIRTQKIAEVRRQRSIDAGRDYSPLGTSSGSGSRITLNDSDSWNGDYDKGKSPRPRKGAYGVREEEYDDPAMEKAMELDFLGETQNLIAFCIRDYNRQIEPKVAENVEKKRKEYYNALGAIDKRARDELKVATKEKCLEIENFKKKEKAMIDKILKDVEVKRLIFEKENQALDLIAEEEFKADQEVLKRQSEKAAAFKEAARVASAQAEAAKLAANAAKARAEDEERKRQLELQKVAEDETEKRRQEAELTNRQAKEAALKLETEKLIADSSKAESSSVALKGLILKEDCNVYENSTRLIKKYEDATRDITPSSTDPNIKKFYASAVNCINTPLNTVANTDDNVVAQRTKHFIDLIEGKPVIGSSAMTSQFQSSVMPNGKIFCLRLLAFRFVRKAESEILSEKKGFAPLATVGVSICKRYPEWAGLVQAHFYKQCPFLVPFNFPKGNKTVQEYCQSLGHDLKGTRDSELWNELVARIKGYCSLYAIMIQTFAKTGQFNLGEPTSFFTIGGLWQILSKMMKLEPQPEVTVVVIQTLLELMSDDLYRAYGRQFQKLMHVLISQYLPKIDSVSIGSAKASVNRFQTFLEQKFRMQPN